MNKIDEIYQFIFDNCNEDLSKVLYDLNNLRPYVELGELMFRNNGMDDIKRVLLNPFNNDRYYDLIQQIKEQGK